MTMKQFITRLAVVALTIAAMVSCGKDADYTNIIPEEPIVLVEVDGYKTMQEGGIIDLIAPYREQAANMLGSQAGELVKNIILDVDNTGIATEAPMYFFVTNEENPNDVKIVVLAKVGDKAKLGELVAFVEENIGDIRKREEGDAVVLSIEDEEEVMVGYNNEAIILVAHPDGDIASSDVLALLKKTATPRKTELEPMKGNSRLVLNLKPLFEMMDKADLWSQVNLDAETLAQVESARNAVLTIDNIITDGKIINTWTVSGMDEEMFETSVENMPVVTNAFAEYIPKEAWVVANFAINDTVIEAIDKAMANVIATQGMGAAELKLVMSFLGTLSGDVTLALNGVNIPHEAFDAQAIIGTKDNSIYNYASLGALAMGITADSNGLAMPLNSNNMARLGQSGDNILWAGINTILGKQSHSIEEAAWFDTVEDKVSYAAVNIDSIFNDYAVRNAFEEALYDELDDEAAVEMVMEMVDLMDYAVLYSEVDASECESSVTLELVLKNDDTNSLKQMVEIVEQQLSTMIAVPAMMGF